MARIWLSCLSGMGSAIGVSLLLAPALPPILAGVAEMKGEIRVRVVGLRSDEGEVRFGLYNRKETFATKDGSIVKGAHPIKDRTCEFVIANVPHGMYGVVVGHDVNREGKVSEDPFAAELKGVSNYSGKIHPFAPRCAWAATECLVGDVPFVAVGADHWSRCLRVDQLASA